MSKTKTVAIICIVLGVLLIGGFTLLMLRKQSVDPETGEVKSYFGKKKVAKTTDPEENKSPEK